MYYHPDSALKMKWITGIVLVALFVAPVCQADSTDIFFAEGVVHDIELDLPYNNWFDVLRQTHETEEYVVCSVTFEGVTYDSVGIRFKGNSSYSHPGIKKPIKLKFNEFRSGARFYQIKTLNFGNSFIDPTMMREKLFLDFCEAQGITCARLVYANIYINGDLIGLYTAIEQVNGDFLERHWGDGEDGNLFKGDPRGNLIWRGDQQYLYENDYSLETNTNDNDWSDLINLIDVLNNSSFRDMPTELSEVIDMGEFLSYEAVGGLFVNLDAYRGTGHNYYIYHADSDDRFHYIPWDCNEAFGTFNFNLPAEEIINLNLFWVGNPPQSRPLLHRTTDHPLFGQLYLRRVQDLMDGAFHPDSLHERIENLANLIRDDVYADPNKMFTNAQFESNRTDDVQAGPRNVIGLERFVEGRYEWVQEQLGEIDFNPPMRINEVLADNVTVIDDEAGEFDDYVELFNISEEPVSLYDMGLSDRIGGEIWRLPDIIVDPGDFIIIWCDGDEEQGSLHAPFQLNSIGEHVVLYEPHGDLVWDYLRWGELAEDISFGRYTDGRGSMTRMAPTPGDENSDRFPPIFSETARQPMYPGADDDVWITACIESNGELESVELNYRINGGNWTTRTLQDDGQHEDGWADDNRYGAMISAAGDNAHVEYYLIAEDSDGRERSDPLTAPDELYSFNTGIDEADGLVINEFQAANSTTIEDPQGEFDDWIELYNGTDETLDLEGYTLTDNLDEPARWTFPAGVSIEPGEFLLIWTDNDDGDYPGLHANFRLGAGGEEIGLFTPVADGGTLLDTLTFGAQQADYSYGRETDGGENWIEFASPTPGESNSGEFVGEVTGSKPFKFHLDAPYPNPFNPSATIRFGIPAAGIVRLTVFDILGREAAILFLRNVEAGDYQVSWNAGELSAGVYFLRLEQGKQVQVHKALLLK